MRLDVWLPRRCFITVARVSARLLAAALRVAAAPRRRAYLELRLPSECARQRRLHDNCAAAARNSSTAFARTRVASNGLAGTAADLFALAPERRGGLFAFSGSRRHRRFVDPLRGAHRLQVAWDASPNDTLWHPLKDAGGWRVGR